MVSNIIKYSGLNGLIEEDQITVKNIVEKEFPRIQRLLKNITDLYVDVKTHDKGGKRKLYIIHMRTVSPTKIFAYTPKEIDAKKSDYWDIASATHKAIEALENEIKHKLKSDTENWKKTGVKKVVKSRLNE